MTKDEALRMAIEALIYHTEQTRPIEDTDKAIQACKDALEPTVAELNDEYLRDTYVEGLSQTAQEPLLITRIACPESNIKQPAQEPFDVVQDSKGNLVSLNTTPPSREWVGLSDAEIGRLAVFDGLHHVEIPLLAKFILAIEQALREKNNG